MTKFARIGKCGDFIREEALMKITLNEDVK